MGVGAIQNIVRFLHISSKIWFESLYRVAENDLTMKAGFFFCDRYYEKTRILPS
jgi:hypothetical protein